MRFKRNNKMRRNINLLNVYILGVHLVCKYKRYFHWKVLLGRLLPFQVHKSVRSAIRRLTHLYARFSQGGEHETFYCNLLDMFRRQNFSRLVQAVEIYTTFKKNGIERLKAGLKHELYYLIKTSVNITKANFFSA